MKLFSFIISLSLMFISAEALATKAANISLTSLVISNAPASGGSTVTEQLASNSSLIRYTITYTPSTAVDFYNNINNSQTEINITIPYGFTLFSGLTFSSGGSYFNLTQNALTNFLDAEGNAIYSRKIVLQANSTATNVVVPITFYFDVQIDSAYKGAIIQLNVDDNLGLGGTKGNSDSMRIQVNETQVLLTCSASSTTDSDYKLYCLYLDKTLKKLATITNSSSSLFKGFNYYLRAQILYNTSNASFLSADLAPTIYGPDNNLGTGINGHYYDLVIAMSVYNSINANKLKQLHDLATNTDYKRTLLALFDNEIGPSQIADFLSSAVLNIKSDIDTSIDTTSCKPGGTPLIGCNGPITTNPDATSATKDIFMGDLRKTAALNSYSFFTSSFIGVNNSASLTTSNTSTRPVTQYAYDNIGTEQFFALKNVPLGNIVYFAPIQRTGLRANCITSTASLATDLTCVDITSGTADATAIVIPRSLSGSGTCFIGATDASIVRITNNGNTNVNANNNYLSGFLDAALSRNGSCSLNIPFNFDMQLSTVNGNAYANQEAKYGDILEYTIVYANTSSVQSFAPGVISALIPDGTEYVPGSMTTTNPKFGVNTPAATPTRLRWGTSSSELTPKEAATLRFKVKVTAVDPSLIVDKTEPGAPVIPNTIKTISEDSQGNRSNAVTAIMPTGTYDHLDISFISSNFSCASIAVTVKACADRSCSSQVSFPLNGIKIPVTTIGTAVVTPNPIVVDIPGTITSGTADGSAVVFLKIDSADTIIIDNKSINYPSSAYPNIAIATCNGSTSACSISVADSGFAFFDAYPTTDLTLGTNMADYMRDNLWGNNITNNVNDLADDYLIANKNRNIYLAAVTSTSTGECTTALADKTQLIYFTHRYVNPNVANMAKSSIRISNTNHLGTSRSISISNQSSVLPTYFDAKGIATLDSIYYETGKINIDATYTPTDGSATLSGNIDIVSIPADICIDATANITISKGITVYFTTYQSTEECKSGDPLNADGNCPPFAKATGTTISPSGINNSVNVYAIPIKYGYSCIAPQNLTNFTIDNTGSDHLTLSVNSSSYNPADFVTPNLTTYHGTTGSSGYFDVLLDGNDTCNISGDTRCSKNYIGVDNVGIFNFQFNRDGNDTYMGVKLPVSSPSKNLRFIPSYFHINAVSKVDPRYNINKNSNQCTNLAYINQPLESDIVIEAQADDGKILTNYRGNFVKAKFKFLATNNSYTDLSQNLKLSDLSGVEIDTFDSTYGSISIITNATSTNSLIFKQDTTSGIFDNVYIGITSDDGEAEAYNFTGYKYTTFKNLLSTDPINKIDIFGKQIENESYTFKYGRLTLENTYGMPSDVLKMPVKVEYWDSISNMWLLNEDDDCTDLSQQDLTDLPTPNYTATAGLSPANISVDTKASLTRGKGNFTWTNMLAQPGNIIFKYDLKDLSWFQQSILNPINPSAGTYWGIGGDQRILYWSENK